MQYTDLLLVDIKHIDEKSHKELTGKTNKNILDMIMKIIKFFFDLFKNLFLGIPVIFCKNLPRHNKHYKTDGNGDQADPKHYDQCDLS